MPPLRGSGVVRDCVCFLHAVVCLARRVLGAAQECSALLLSACLVFFGAQPVDEHLLYGFVVGHEDVTDGVAAYEVANFLG
jgi:hypothetical protein